nr:MAG: replication associated protein [Arizlama virus]
MDKSVQRSWCWTQFVDIEGKSVEEKAEFLKQFVDRIEEHHGRYTVFAMETTKDAKVHLQGYSEFDKVCRGSALKKLWDSQSLHYEKRLGSREQAREYCRGWDAGMVIIPGRNGEPYSVHGKPKVGVMYVSGKLCQEFGVWDAGGQGKRNDWLRLVENIERGDSFEELLVKDPQKCIMYPHGVEKAINVINERNQRELMLEHWKNWKPSKWQQKILDIIEGPTDGRKILWIYDTKGHTGKSEFCAFLEDTKGIFYYDAASCKGVDVACQLNHCKRPLPNVCVFDLQREKDGILQYSILECIANGRLTSTKFEGGRLIWNERPHVVVFANWTPDVKTMSDDRWNILELGEGWDCEIKQSYFVKNSIIIPSTTMPPVTEDTLESALGTLIIR